MTHLTETGPDKRIGNPDLGAIIRRIVQLQSHTTETRAREVARAATEADRWHRMTQGRRVLADILAPLVGIPVACPNPRGSDPYSVGRGETHVVQDDRRYGTKVSITAWPNSPGPLLWTATVADDAETYWAAGERLSLVECLASAVSAVEAWAAARRAADGVGQ
jgi:hypothetical protein